MLGTTNRVTAYADKLRAQIASGRKPDGSPLGDLAKLDETMAISLAEFVSFQNLKSRAQVSGVLTVDEAMTIYAALGDGYSHDGNGGWAPGVDLAMKVTITELMAQLVGVRR